MPGLSLKGLYAYDNQYSLGKSFHKKYFQYQYLFDADNQPYYNPSVYNAPSNLQEDYSQNVRKDAQFSINYQKVFGKHTVSGLALYEQSDRIYNSHSAYTQFIIDEVDKMAAGDHTTICSIALPSAPNSPSMPIMINAKYTRREVELTVSGVLIPPTITCPRLRYNAPPISAASRQQR